MIATHIMEVISIHALREEGDCFRTPLFVAYSISIHALREEGDSASAIRHLHALDISIHALREEGDLLTKVLW